MLFIIMRIGAQSFSVMIRLIDVGFIHFLESLVYPELSFLFLTVFSLFFASSITCLTLLAL